MVMLSISILLALVALHAVSYSCLSSIVKLQLFFQPLTGTCAKSPIGDIQQSHQAIFIGEQTIPLKFFPAGV